MKLRGNHCQCGACGRYFNSLTAFDKHRTGPFSHNVLSRECLTDEQMVAKGMSVSAKGWWVGSKYANPSRAYDSRTGDRP